NRSPTRIACSTRHLTDVNRTSRIRLRIGPRSRPTGSHNEAANDMNQKLVDIAFFLLRVVTGLLFIQFGGMKLFGWFGGMPGGPPPLLSQIGIGAVLEVFGGALILVGQFTRPVAF